jgi:pyrroloquinoline quinone biosynthesis protein D
MHDAKLSCRPEDVFALSRGVRLQFEAAQNSWVLLYLEGMVQLSETAVAILQPLDGVSPVARIIQNLDQLYSAETGPDVIEFLETAFEYRWVQRSNA